MHSAKKKLLVVTDLDGTLLDERYSWSAARNSVRRLDALGFPLVLNSSKTLAELIEIAKELNTNAPVIAENGGVIAIPKDSVLSALGDTTTLESGYQVEFAGESRATILSVAHRLRTERGYRFEGFSDWSPDQISEKTGLSTEQAGLAAERLATEPILWNDSADRWDEFISSMSDRNIRALKGGRFVHLLGMADKASAMLDVLEKYRKYEPGVTWSLVALGDSPNDAEMLSSADIAVVIPTADGHQIAPGCPLVIEARSTGPTGWNEAMIEILNDYS